MSFSELIKKKLEWNERYSTGIDVVDITHLKLFEKFINIFERIKDFKEADQNIALLDECREFIGILKFHAETEETILREYGVSMEIANQHDAHHKEYLNWICLHEKELRSGQVGLTVTVFNLLARDFLKHVEFEVQLFSGLHKT